MAAIGDNENLRETIVALNGVTSAMKVQSSAMILQSSAIKFQNEQTTRIANELRIAFSTSEAKQDKATV